MFLVTSFNVLVADCIYEEEHMFLLSAPRSNPGESQAAVLRCWRTRRVKSRRKLSTTTCCLSRWYEAGRSTWNSWLVPCGGLIRWPCGPSPRNNKLHARDSGQTTRRLKTRSLHVANSLIKRTRQNVRCWGHMKFVYFPCPQFPETFMFLGWKQRRCGPLFFSTSRNREVVESKRLAETFAKLELKRSWWKKANYKIFKIPACDASDVTGIHKNISCCVEFCGAIDSGQEVKM